MSEFDKMERWANGVRDFAARGGTPQVGPVSDLAAGREAAHGARVNPAPPPSQYVSPGSANHFDTAKAAAQKGTVPQWLSRLGPEVGPAQAAAAAAAPAAAPAATGMRTAVGGAFKNVASGLAGTAAGIAKGNVVVGSALGALDGATTPIETYEKRFGFGPTESDGSVAGNIGAGLRDAGTRYLGMASDMGNRMAFGLLKDNLYRDGEVAPATVKPTTAQPTLRAGAPDTTRGQPRTAGGRGVVNPSVVDPNAAPPTNGLASNLAPDLPNGVRKLQQGGSTLYTNVAGDNADMFRPGTISAQNSAAADALSDRYGAEARAMAQRQIDGAKPQGLRARLAQQLEGKELTAKGVAALARAEELDNAREDRATTNAITLRGQDIADRGHLMAAKSAREKLLYEAKKDDRTYNFEREKFGETEANNRFNRRQQATKDLHAEISSMIPSKDGKPDTDTAARYVVGINGWMSEKKGELAKLAAAGDRKAAAALEDLDKNGLGALDERVKRQLIQGFKINDLSAEAGSGGLNPFGGTDVYTDKPAGGLRNMNNGFLGSRFGNEYEVLGPDGKPTGARIPARYVDRDGSFIGGQRRIDLRDAYK